MSKAGKVGEGREAEGGGQNSGLGCPGTAEGAASGEAESGNEAEQGERERRARSSPGSQSSRIPLGAGPARPVPAAVSRRAALPRHFVHRSPLSWAIRPLAIATASVVSQTALQVLVRIPGSFVVLDKRFGSCRLSIAVVRIHLLE